MDGPVPLAGDWLLWRDFAVRSAGFPVSGLEAFGGGDESARLRDVARDELFREAVTWQNPAALENAVVKVAEGKPTKPSRARQREELVASYWQRYCAKNDTIGFFGPLAWGRIEDDGPRLDVRSGSLVAERAVHFEAWPIQALAQTLDPDLRIANSPYPERDLRSALGAHSDTAVRERGLAALARLEDARAALAEAPPERLRDALAELDRVFVELTGAEPVRNAGRAYGARTLSYVDCMRDLEVTLGPGLIADVAPALHVLFEASRWFNGRIHAIGRRVVEAALPASGSGPFAPVLMQSVKTLMQLPPEIDDEITELHRRLGALLADPEPATIGARAVEAFADHGPAWPHSVFSSADLQLAAASTEAVAAGDYLAVVGDVHPGGNPLLQGVFAHRFPGPRSLPEIFSAELGPGAPFLMPPFAPGLGVDARGAPALADDMIPFAVMPDTRMPGGRRIWLPDELRVEGMDVVDSSGELRVPLLAVLAMPIFLSGIRTFSLVPDEEHSERLTIGRTVLKRESWSVPAGEVPDSPDALSTWAECRGMPRRLFAKSPLERKPMYVDVESPVLCRILCRHARRAAAEAPGGRMELTEMLPGPGEAWLADPEGNRYVSELRLVAVDRTKRAAVAAG